MLTAIALVMLTPLPDIGHDPSLPSLSDLVRFPDRKTAESRGHRLFDQECRLLYQDSSPERYEALRQIEHALKCWDLLLGAQDKAFRERGRRECLKELKQLLGDENYRRGQMP
jgi:hypothetical protein